MPSRVTRWLRLWFTFESGVGRREYLLSGLALAALKYAGDAFMVWCASGRFWRPIDYLSPVTTLLQTKLAMAPAGRCAALVRASVAQCTARDCRRDDDRARGARAERLRTVELRAFALPRHAVRDRCAHGVPLQCRYPASARETQQVVLMTLACVGGVLLVTAAEGALCLIMAAPLGIGIGAMGAALGRRIAIRDRSLAGALMAVVVLPVSATFDAASPPTELREVRSAIEIAAPPDAVWRNVIAFPPLPAPRELVFRAGVAYPVRAVISGQGVGAVRRCVFSTGAFVEPITRWEPGSRLSFDVDSQPRPLQEWCPYRDVAAPHLDGYFLSRRGEFRLIALPNGHTRLEGSTWYEMKLQPAAYWVLYGDAIVHRIHMQVLEHIRATAETEMTHRIAAARRTGGGARPLLAGELR
jgi:hypothetical protein